MSTTSEPDELHRRIIASVVGGIGGALFIMINASPFSPVTSTILRIVAVGALAWVLVRAWQFRDRHHSGRRSGFGRAYWMIVALEAVLIFGGRAVIVGLLDTPSTFLPWLSLAVGLHFFAFVLLWHKQVYFWLGLLVTTSAIAAFVLVAIGGAPAAVVVFSAMIPGATLLTAGVAGVETAAAHGGWSHVRGSTHGRSSQSQPHHGRSS